MNLAAPTRMIAHLLARSAGEPLRDLRLELRPLRGGLEAEGVTAVLARYRAAAGEPRLLHLVAKVLGPRGGREPAVYESLRPTAAAALAPRVLGAEVSPRGGVLLLEHLRPLRAWPWDDTGHASDVLRCVALLHATAPVSVALPGWDYDGDLERSAADTVHAVERARGSAAVDRAGSVAAVRRIGTSVTAVRRTILAGPLAPAVLHGDLHPGNAVVRRTRGRAAHRIALIDWQRARVGSSLEDVSSFLQSLAHWEPRVRARHDTLLGDYLEARGLSRIPTRELRDLYWLAAASNALAGALAYHVRVATSDAVTERTRGAAERSARDWLRIVRRADAVWTPPGVVRPKETGAAGCAR